MATEATEAKKAKAFPKTMLIWYETADGGQWPVAASTIGELPDVDGLEVGVYELAGTAPLSVKRELAIGEEE